MNGAMVVDNTEISGKTRVSLEAPQASPLLEDDSEQKLFAMHFSDTSIENRGVNEIKLFAGNYFTTPAEDFLTDNAISFIEETKSSTWSTPLQTERIAHHSKSFAHRNEQDEVDPITKLTEERITLLARRYVAKENYTDEELARLAIVTERVRKLMPAVTAQEYEALEKTLTSLQAVSLTNAGLREKLRLAKQENG